ncbi:MAG TPA: DUF1559 domain-containing protein, partial [Gemmataceae bacterium]|nr:DUF1559 domain-containing protein [Gemmataceae bacterium]
MTTGNRSAFTLFQMLLLVAILVILLALLLPALVGMRQAAARTRSQNNLRQLMIGAHNYNDVYNLLPPGLDDKHFSAASKLLPFVAQQSVFNNIDFKKSIADKANARMRQLVIKTFLSPQDPISIVKPEWGATNYLFNDQLFFPDLKMSIIEVAKGDGTSFTLAIGETLKGDGKTQAMDIRRQYVLLKKEDLKNTGPDTGVKYFKDDKNIAGDRCASWMDGRFLQGSFNGRLRPNDERPDVSCGGISGVSALRSFEKHVLVGMCDCSVRTVSNAISHKTWKAA